MRSSEDEYGLIHYETRITWTIHTLGYLDDNKGMIRDCLIWLVGMSEVIFVLQNDTLDTSSDEVINDYSWLIHKYDPKE